MDKGGKRPNMTQTRRTVDYKEVYGVLIDCFIQLESGQYKKKDDLVLW